MARGQFLGKSIKRLIAEVASGMADGQTHLLHAQLVFESADEVLRQSHAKPESSDDHAG
jgi:hypothetical protein